MTVGVTDGGFRCLTIPWESAASGHTEFHCFNPMQGVSATPNPSILSSGQRRSRTLRMTGECRVQGESLCTDQRASTEIRRHRNRSCSRCAPLFQNSICSGISR